ncbi:MAG: DUF2273 domain-containing protein [Eubacteriales bacterium]|nr:DUF2273 domain-containing protein [Eubacteriales bacterium]
MQNRNNFIKDLISGISSGGAGAKGARYAFVLALLLVIFGFFKTLFILLITVLGYYIGTRYFGNLDDFKELLDKIFPPGYFR